MKLVISPLAERDLEEIGDYIARDNPLRAVSFINEIAEQCAKIAEGPEHYRAWKELDENIRVCPFSSWLIVFSFHAQRVRIERILHGARDIRRLLTSGT